MIRLASTRNASRLFALLFCFLVLACVATRAFAASEKTTFVLVYGATAGGWQWRSTGKFLSDDVPIVYRATLTGLGERHSVKHSIKCFNQPVSYKNPAALSLPVTYVAFVPKDKSAEERAKMDKIWQRAVA